jgi:long-chain acyl-CoA synthetase
VKNKTLPELFEASVGRYTENVLLWEKKHDKYEGMTYGDCEKQVRRTSLGLLKLGLEKGDRVALISEGRNDWVISELAILFCGAICVPLSVKIDEPADLLFRLEHAGCKGIIVSRNHQHKVFSLAAELSEPEFVVVLDPLDEAARTAMANQNSEIIDIDTLRTEGDKYQDQLAIKLEEVKESLLPNDYANICYTSGTTADPKGIILSHQNYLHNVEQASLIFDVPPEFISLHILPWDHSFAHTVGIYALIRNGASLASLKIGKTLNETLRNIPVCINEIRPHFLLSVPALAKNFRKNIENGVKSKGPVALALFRMGLRVAYAYNRRGNNKAAGCRRFLKPVYALFDKILFRKVRAGFGGRLKFFVGGGALLDIELQRFFFALGMPMYQGYGLTEASPVISSNTPDFHKMGSSGKVVPDLDLKICGDDGQEKPFGEQGEIVVRGENVMVGYWKNKKATADALKDGWLYTGDLGYLDKDGYLYVLGRTKSLLIGSDGEKYSPEGIEEAMMEKSPYFDQVMLHNNQSPYTVALIVINKPAVLSYLSQQGLSAASEEGQESALRKLRSEIDRYLPEGELGGMFPPRWLPAATAFIPEPFSESNGLINSTMKIVRPAIHKYYEARIESLFTPMGKSLMSAENKTAIASVTA